MKTVGKQMQEARLAKNWTPEMAARETKIKVDRLRDLEADDYSHFTSATYAREFVRTYSRSLGLDEYTILRQLDNKLPEDDSANIPTEGGVAYLPETSLPPRAAHRDFTGLYVTMGLGLVVALAIVFVLFRAYQVGELGQWLGSTSATGTEASTESAAKPAESPSRALPVDSDTPPPVTEPVAKPVVDAAPAPKAQPVDPAAAVPVAADPAPDSGVKAPRAQPVNLSDLNAAEPSPENAPKTKAPPRALPVSPEELASTTPPPSETPPVTPSTSNPVKVPSEAPAPHSETSLPPAETPASADTSDGQTLILTASRDSFVRVTAIDTASGDKPVYAAVLHSGQSVGFNGHKFSVAVDNPSAVAIRLDRVNYGPHSDHSDPETFTVTSHVQ